MTSVRAGLALSLALLGVLGIGALPASAGPIGWQGSGGWYTDSGDFFLGAGARFGLGSFAVIPNGEWLFLSSGSMYTLNLDATMSVLPLGVASGYMGAGLGFLARDPEGGDSSTDTVFNLIAGAGFNAIPLKPFAQLKYIMVDGDDPVVLAIGARF